MKISSIMFSYVDPKHCAGAFINFVDELDVLSIEYEDIVKALEKKYPELDNISVMCFTKN